MLGDLSRAVSSAYLLFPSAEFRFLARNFHFLSLKFWRVCILWDVCVYPTGMQIVVFELVLG